MAIVPRKKLIYTDEYPYHVMARSNNREWFYVSKEDAWNIFVSEVNRTISRQGTLIHSFVLMDNHYHMLISATEENDLGTVMRELQGRVSRRINRTSKRINSSPNGKVPSSSTKS